MVVRIAVRIFLRELEGASPDGKGDPLLGVRWCSGKGLTPDTHTKGLPANGPQEYRSGLAGVLIVVDSKCQVVAAIEVFGIGECVETG